MLQLCMKYFTGDVTMLLAQYEVILRKELSDCTESLLNVSLDFQYKFEHISDTNYILSICIKNPVKGLDSCSIKVFVRNLLTFVVNIDSQVKGEPYFMFRELFFDPDFEVRGLTYGQLKNRLIFLSRGNASVPAKVCVDGIYSLNLLPIKEIFKTNGVLNEKHVIIPKERDGCVSNVGKLLTNINNSKVEDDEVVTFKYNERIISISGVVYKNGEIILLNSMSDSMPTCWNNMF